MIKLPPWIVLDPLLHHWLLEDIGRGDRSTQGLQLAQNGKAVWVAKERGIIAGLTLASRIFYLLEPTTIFTPLIADGETAEKGQMIAEIEGPLECLLMGERAALNIVMRLSGIATLTRKYVEVMADLSTQLVDTRKTTPGLRILEKYAVQVGGAVNHRMGLDDAVMIKDNHILSAGSITNAIAQLRYSIPYPLTIEVETSNFSQVAEAIASGANTIMLDNMTLEEMKRAVELIRREKPHIDIEASGNITLDNLRLVAKTGVDYISSSAPVTRSSWLDLSMRLIPLE
ncbi:MAG: carboxylating nicotinate-nucleotide diphosphorylase [Snowella sp.]|jgi:nicotinate-nucleotide pyrophosphorylase (carboxylating)|nr:MAG: carboxylating nicotinate-nucleotide diphosphorylase [Snowella sp.]